MTKKASKWIMPGQNFPELSMALKRRDDSHEIAHEEFMQTEENVPGIYIGITPQYRGQQIEVFPRQHE